MAKTLAFVLLGQDRLTPVVRRAGKETEKSAHGISGAMKGAGLSFLGFGTVVAGVMGKAVADARGLNLTPLKIAAQDAGIAWKAFKPQVDAAGASMGKLGFTQGQTNQALTKLVTATGNSKVSLAALSTAADLARYKHIGLTDASLALGRAAAGNTRALKELGISTSDLPKHFANTGTSASRLNIIMDLMNKKIGGQAVGYTKTFGGKLDVLKAQMTNVSASIGVALLPMLTSLITKLSSVLVPLSRNKSAFATLAVGITLFAITARVALAAFATSARAALITSVVGIAILGLTIAITLLLTHWKQVMSAMRTAVNAFRNFAIDALKAIVNYFLWMPGVIINAAAKAFGWVPGLGPKLKAAAAKFNEFRDNVNSSLNGLKGKTVPVSVRMTAATNPYPGGISGRAAAGGKITGPGGPTSDRAGLFALSNDEWVIKASSASKYGHHAMAAVNDGRAVIGYAGGGSPGLNLVTSTPSKSTIDSSIWNNVVKLVKNSWQMLLGTGQSVLSLARQYIGTPYVWGGSSPAGWDCSGFVSWIYNRLGLHSGRDTAAGLQGWAQASGPVPGGMAFYGWPAHHVGFVYDSSHLLSALGTNYGTIISALNMGDNSGYGIPPHGFGGSGGPPVGGGSLRELAYSMLIQRGWGGQWASFNALENREAAWNMSAVNPSSGAYGLAQFINGAGEYAQYGGTWLTATGQLTGMLNYIAQRYGSPNSAWAHEVSAGWYDRGGWLKPGYTMAYNGTGRPERVLAPGAGAGVNVYVTVQGHALASKQEIARTVADSLKAFKAKGGNV